jgi:hypothetical protein
MVWQCEMVECVLVLSMCCVSSNISFQVYPLLFHLSSQRKKLNKNDIYNCESEVAFNSVVLFIICTKIPLHFSIYSVTDYSGLHVPFITTINTI